MLVFTVFGVRHFSRARELPGIYETFRDMSCGSRHTGEDSKFNGICRAFSTLPSIDSESLQ